MARHKHVALTIVHHRFTACANPKQCNPEAHHGYTRVAVCACGKVQLVNVKGKSREHSRWHTPT